jgi:hypothetical protein
MNSLRPFARKHSDAAQKEADRWVREDCRHQSSDDACCEWVIEINLMSYPLVSHRAQCRALLESSARHPEPFGDVSSGKAGCDGHRSQRQRLQSTCRRTPGMRVDDVPSLVQQPSCPSLLLVALTCARTAPDRRPVYRFADCDARDSGRRAACVALRRWPGRAQQASSSAPPAAPRPHSPRAASSSGTLDRDPRIDLPCGRLPPFTRSDVSCSHSQG